MGTQTDHGGSLTEVMIERTRQIVAAVSMQVLSMDDDVKKSVVDIVINNASIK
ncbi:unnamed protein product, partial [Heterobilharzia americana]